MRVLLALPLALLVVACSPEQEVSSEPPIRGLKTHLVEDSERSTVRRFPSVIEPTSLNTLSFEIGGKLTEVDLQVGQSVEEGQTLAELDPEALEVQVTNAEAGVRSAQAAFDNAEEALLRQRTLFESGTVTRATLDAAETDALTKKAQLEQAQASVETAEENLENSILVAPFDGIINSVDAQSFATVSTGTPIISLYSPDAFEMSISVNFNTVSQLVVGTPATVRLADRPDIALKAVVSELGSRADTVSSFPVVLMLTEVDPILKAGMAVEVTIELPLPAEAGFSIPIEATIKEGTIEDERGVGQAFVYVFDDATSTVNRRQIRLGGVRENSLLVIEGLEPGERIASAGVSFLRDGQEVKLLSDGE